MKLAEMDLGDVDSREQQAFHGFLKAYPEYAETQILDRLRAEEYARLDQQGHVYLDYTGGGLYGQSQLDRHLALLSGQVFGNPHSHNPTSMAMTELVEEARSGVLAYFNASPEEYVAAFTPNASGALKLVGESYPFGPGGHYALCADDHNSVNGIREMAKARGAQVTYIPVLAPDLRLDMAAVQEVLATGDSAAPRLLAYPAQSNFSGVKHPLSLIADAQDRGWDVLLDAAAFAPTNRLDLSRWHPDFVSLSFYKMFGYPTGVGALLVRRSALARLRRPWFAGGTVKIVSVQAQGHFLVEGEAAFEDGTVNYLSLPAVQFGLEHLQRIGMETISTRVRSLTGWLLEALAGLRHGNDRPLVQILGPRDLEMRGGTVALKLSDPRGIPIPSDRIEELAAEEGISLRTGCFCNPGAGEIAHRIPEEAMAGFFSVPGGPSFAQFTEQMLEERGINVNAIRVSVGLVSNFRDLYRLLDFFATLLDRSSADIGKAAAPPASSAYLRDSA